VRRKGGREHCIDGKRRKRKWDIGGGEEGRKGGYATVWTNRSFHKSIGWIMKSMEVHEGVFLGRL